MERRQGSTARRQGWDGRSTPAALKDKQPGRLPREVGWGMGDRVGVEAEVEVEG